MTDTPTQPNRIVSSIRTVKLVPGMAKHGSIGEAMRSRRDLQASLVLIAALSFSSLSAGVFSAQDQNRALNHHIDGNQLANEVVQNELHAQAEDQSLWRYREAREEGSKRELLEVIETRDGEVRRLLSINGHTLSHKERDIDDKRTKKVLSDSHEFQEKQKIRSEDADQERKLMMMLPTAFDYQYDGEDEDFIRLKFIPKPDFHPRGRENEVFHHMEGTMLVDLHRRRLAGLDGRLTEEVKFMGGLLGHLDRGGIFSVRQRDVGSGHWKMTMLHVQMNGKALLFKTIALHEKEEFTNFQPLPDNMTLEKAAELLEKDRAS
jgi:hypothetical protein